MAEPKTRPTEASVSRFIDKLDDEQKRDDCYAIISMMQKAAKAEPKMWGPSIIGFGTAKIKYASGRELDWPKIAFSPRKQALTLYLEPAVLKASPLLDKLGKHKTSKGCLLIKSLEDVDRKTLQQLINTSVKT
jgi:hypothetical protein